ncbi:MAG: ACT domain-containing protein, partial [Pseudonocardia sp.]
FTLPASDGRKGVEALTAIQGTVGFESLRYDDGIGKVSLIGAGMRSHPGVSAKFFSSLADAGVNIEVQYSDHAGNLVLVVDPAHRDACAQVAAEWTRATS